MSERKLAPCWHDSSSMERECGRGDDLDSGPGAHVRAHQGGRGIGTWGDSRDVSLAWHHTGPRARTRWKCSAAGMPGLRLHGGGHGCDRWRCSRKSRFLCPSASSSCAFCLKAEWTLVHKVRAGFHHSFVTGECVARQPTVPLALLGSC